MRRPIRPRHLPHHLHISGLIRPHRNNHARLAEHPSRHERHLRPIHGDQAAGNLMPRRQPGLAQRILETKRAAEQEAYVVGRVYVLQVLRAGDVSARAVDAVLGEVCAEVEIRVGDAGGWGDGLRITGWNDA
ncbi:hypothetical protein CNMCM5623_009404 [Aspergillus felis]|uniref:Uncharacterized protein n=1 Tax=Aspergillus felis TaxID=1287682 RepID=A0A8H6QL13_9EURO|nr:hypothetical protein CNMCM5623_009404 [Aspergillus felis]